MIEAVAEGIYEWSVDTGQLKVSRRLNEMLGFEKDELTSAEWFERVHPEDRSRLRDETVGYFKGATPHFACEYRVRDNAGAWRWIYVISMAVNVYFLLFVLVTQLFLKVPALHALAPNAPDNPEPPFAIAQGILLVVFVWLIWKSAKSFRGVAAAS